MHHYVLPLCPCAWRLSHASGYTPLSAQANTSFYSTVHASLLVQYIQSSADTVVHQVVYLSVKYEGEQEEEDEEEEEQGLSRESGDDVFVDVADDVRQEDVDR